MFHNIVLIDYRRPLSRRTRKVTGPYRWNPTPAGKGRGFYCESNVNGFECAAHGSGFRLRLEPANEHLPNRRLPLSYFADDGGFTRMHPIVARLPHGRGFLAGWTMGEGMCASLDGYVWPDRESAARAAHDEARNAAEAEYQANEDEDVE